jgi:hypothetical protein
MYEVDIQFFSATKGHFWVPYGIPDEKPFTFVFALGAFNEAKRLTSKWGKHTRIRRGETIVQVVTS